MDVCHVCSEPVTNPLCPHCLHETVRQWVEEEDQDMARSIWRLDEVFPDMAMASVHCIRCGRGVEVCPHCYTKEVRDILGKDEQLQAQFTRLFNFHLHAPPNMA
ncbi:hypothetical protein COY28_05565 [Candidatus Woesearchaeota archaeon CG_4_10_14_0_2_um_filter_57_5]|nr:MAG: hypothetical protein AUJ68_02895 [Candidatus Woesearchaeota archaeon CG1_02_57_44]PIN67730.1 MAG: hypothetical protein COV94_06780 [Candidatus Woesearchaeota archaeon CG11_big_fil_rev_8_21_14_0_20_57_5]PIZ50274.1 MAG: hypothetical protein COY28_05565 [Candidatus Woesearchaeota archaeon CG_4_10_14_0_2_um_filter_57_5]